MFPWDLDEPTIIVSCLDIPGTSSDFKIATIAIGTNQTGSTFQFDPALFADGFESGDTSAW